MLMLHVSWLRLSCLFFPMQVHSYLCQDVAIHSHCYSPKWKKNSIFQLDVGVEKNYYLIRLEATEIGWIHNQLIWMRLVCLIFHSICLKSAWKALIPLLWTKSINDFKWKFFVVFAINWIPTIRRNINNRVYINVDKDI